MVLMVMRPIAFSARDSGDAPRSNDSMSRWSSMDSTRHFTRRVVCFTQNCWRGRSCVESLIQQTSAVNRLVDGSGASASTSM
jgi:hypothetical protein